MVCVAAPGKIESYVNMSAMMEIIPNSTAKCEKHFGWSGIVKF